MATPGRRGQASSHSSDDISVDDGDAEMVDAMTVDAQGAPNGAQSSTISAGDLGKVPSVRLKVFDGSRRAGAYREWKKEVEAVQIIHQLTEGNWPRLSTLPWTAKKEDHEKSWNTWRLSRTLLRTTVFRNFGSCWTKNMN